MQEFRNAGMQVCRYYLEEDFFFRILLETLLA
jgi:hypothetical protein